MKEYSKYNPFNYTGSKSKLLSQIIPLFPKEIDTFIDLFCGSCSVGVNVNAENHIFVDNVKELIELLNVFYDKDKNYIISTIEANINSYDLYDKDNISGYLRLRDTYNMNRTWDKFYSLICTSNSNWIRFNKNGDFNMPYGKRTFNKNMKKSMIDFLDKLKSKKATFCCDDFMKIKELIDLENTQKYFVYIDPPYLGTVAPYCESGKWCEDKEKILLELLDWFNQNGIKFALSNNLKNNPILRKWIGENNEKVHVNYINADYGNCNYHKKDRNGDNEVLICNYRNNKMEENK